MENSVQAACPCCGSENIIFIEPDLIDQEWIEDCTACCQPILFSLSGENENLELTAERP